FGIPTQTNHRRNIQIKFPKYFGQSVSGPILFLARNTGTRAEVSDEVGLGQNDSGGAIDLGSGWIAASVGKISDGKSRVHNGVHRHHRSAAACAVKTNQTFGTFGGCGSQLREIKCAAMIALFDGVSHAFERSRGMIEFA